MRAPSLPPSAARSADSEVSIRSWVSAAGHSAANAWRIGTTASATAWISMMRGMGPPENRAHHSGLELLDQIGSAPPAGGPRMRVPTVAGLIAASVVLGSVVLGGAPLA